MVRNIAPKKMIIERKKGRKLSGSVIQADPRIRVPMLGTREIMVPVIPIMVKKRKFSHKNFRTVKGGLIRFLHAGQKRSAGDSSLPQSGQFFIILLCNTSDLINDLMKTGILRLIFLWWDTLHGQCCRIQDPESLTVDDHGFNQKKLQPAAYTSGPPHEA
jgi:hypothetical protein